jgi:hypothetical protein
MSKPLSVQVAVWCRVPQQSADYNEPLDLLDTFAFRSNGDWWYLCKNRHVATELTRVAVNHYPSCSVEEVQIVQVLR